MGDDELFVAGAFGRDARQRRDDVFVGQAVKAVAADAFGGERAGQAEFLGERRRVVMKRGVEAGDLRHVGRDRGDRADRGDVVRLVQRRERHQRFERGQHGVVDQHRRRISGSAMDHAMADAGKAGFTADMGGEPVVNGGHRGVMIVAGYCRVGELAALRVGNFDPRRRSGFRAEPVDLTVRAGRRASGRASSRTPRI